ncbi:MAG TPA: ATP-binding cassette domain-containing protein [Solirubrobacteraceae bacterium]|jgi:daunorubicin resistance ABC transporter ATP-binding subunit|nr:ATP-binding cassette domain-containing protein [Solirubrobacteraceae bacterium]
MTSPTAIEVRDLRKQFGDVTALDGLELDVPAGMVFGLLGPNGAGKTTLVRILATLIEPTSGQARVLGHDVVREPLAVRRRIGLAGQFAAVDGELTGRENLEMIGRLNRLSGAEARARAGELLERFDLTAAAQRRAGVYSGGMRRRLDLAAGLIGGAPVVLLDEPSTGLDPRSRQELWSVVAELADGGVTVLLTTQYLEEADRLASQIAVVDRGRIVAQGTVPTLKAMVGGSVLTLRVQDAQRLAEAAEAVAALAVGDAPQLNPAEGEIRLTVDHPGASSEAIRRLDERRLELVSIELQQPSLDDVFLTLTGHSAQEPTDTFEAEEAAA